MYKLYLAMWLHLSNLATACDIAIYATQQKYDNVFCFNLYTSRKPVRCTRKLLKIKSKLILIPFTFFVEYIYKTYLSPLPATKLNEIHKKKKGTLKILMKIDNYGYY